MAKKKSRSKRPCFICDGTGAMCRICGESERGCDCDEEGNTDFADCEECYGTGIAFMDIIETDLKPEHVEAWKKAREEEFAE